MRILYFNLAIIWSLLQSLKKRSVPARGADLRNYWAGIGVIVVILVVAWVLMLVVKV